MCAEILLIYDTVCPVSTHAVRRQRGFAMPSLASAQFTFFSRPCTETRHMLCPECPDGCALQGQLHSLVWTPFIGRIRLGASPGTPGICARMTLGITAPVVIEVPANLAVPLGQLLHHKRPDQLLLDWQL